ncbi:cobalamin biosynthesis protein [Paracoccus sp. PAR01]|uniref:cobalamin biosynthesis protein n=1 Tax=Paracoccus sp. PAR01 TaxID=2769282 RepID=UPI00177E7E01|nr:cobalamin biosynthesis protein [Paracoccus sp. PAR01]
MIVAGFGFRASASMASLSDALTRALGGGTVDRLATADDKSTARCFQNFAAASGIPAIGITPDLIAVQLAPTRSPASLQARGTGSLAEAAALAAAGRNARLIGPRVISGDRLATCAIAIGEGP